MRRFELQIWIVLLSSLTSPSSVQYPPWLTQWERGVVSLGVIDTLVLNSENGRIIRMPYFKVIGTGVTTYIRPDTTNVTILITAKHVVYEPADSWYPYEVNIRFPWFDDKSVFDYFGIPLVLRGNDSVQLWWSHPDTNVDIAAIPLTDLPDDYGSAVMPVMPYSRYADSADVYPGCTIWVYGYPGAVGNQFLSRAILRQGIISWTSLSAPQNNTILIDAEIYPGNSGGPVFSMPYGLDIEGNLKMGGQSKLVGIVTQRRFSPTAVSFGGYAVVDSLGRKLQSLESMGIGVVEPSHRIIELLDFIKNTTTFITIDR